MKLTADARVYLFIFAVSIFAIFWSLLGVNYRFESKLLPVLIGSLVAILAAAGLYSEVRTEKTHAEVSGMDRLLAQESWRGYLVHFGWLSGFLIAIYLIGYLLAMPIFLFIYTRRLGSEFHVAIISAVAVTVFIYVAFELGLDIKLYRGLFFSWLSWSPMVS